MYPLQARELFEDDELSVRLRPVAIGVEFGSRIVELTDGPDKGKRIKLQIWDTAGQVRLTFPVLVRGQRKTDESRAKPARKQESFRAITRSYYRGAGGALLVFSLTSHQSFTNCRGWLSDLRSWGEDDLLILLVGNKGDVTAEGEVGTGGEKREVEREEAERWAEEEGLAGYVETSAKSGAGVEEVRTASPFHLSLSVLLAGDGRLMEGVVLLHRHSTPSPVSSTNDIKPLSQRTARARPRPAHRCLRSA
jgi:GTPase SAR1 family protein